MGFLMVAAVVAIFVVVGARMVPAYIEYYSVQKSLEKVAGRPARSGRHRRARKSFDSYLATDYIESVRASDLEIDQRGQRHHGERRLDAHPAARRQREPLSRVRGEGDTLTGTASAAEG